MRYALFAIATLSLCACSQDDFYRGRVTANGTATAQAVRVVKGVEEPVSALYTLTGQGEAVVQTVKPFLTLTGSWQKSASAAGSIAEEPDAVLLRPAAVAFALPGGSGPCMNTPAPAAPRFAECAPAAAGNSCAVPQAPKAAPCAPPPPVALAAPPCAAPLAGPRAERPCGTPVYTSPASRECEADPTWNRADLMRHAGKPLWPCATGPQAYGAPPGGPLMLPVVITANVISCLINFIKCLIGGLIP